MLLVFTNHFPTEFATKNDFKPFPDPLALYNMPATAIQTLKAHYESQSENHCLDIQHIKSINQIVLIRHGEPEMEKATWVNRKAALSYILNYDTVGVIPLENSLVNFNKLQLSHVFSSPTPRALHSAKLLFGNHVEVTTHNRFREFEREIFWFPKINIYLPLKFWTIFSRILWVLGLNSKGIENRRKAYERAGSNAIFLAEDARKHGVTVLVAHGFHNKVVIDRLKKSGWTLLRKGGKGFWAVNILGKARVEKVQ